MADYLRSLAEDHPGVLVTLALSLGVIFSGGMHLYVTGEPLSAALSNPFDSVAIGLFFFIFALLNLAVWAFLPALFTGAVVRWQARRIVFSRFGDTTIAVSAGAITAISCYAMIYWNPEISELSAAILLLLALFSAATAVAAPFPIFRSERWRWAEVLAIAVCWLFALVVWIAFSSTVLQRTIAETGWLSDPATPVWFRHVLVSVILGASVFAAALVPGQRDWVQILMAVMLCVIVLAAIGAMRPAYSAALRITGFGQETVARMWLAPSACVVVETLSGVSVQSLDDKTCHVDNVFVVARTDAVLVLSASEAMADRERVRIPKSSHLGDVRREEKPSP